MTLFIGLFICAGCCGSPCCPSVRQRSSTSDPCRRARLRSGWTGHVAAGRIDEVHVEGIFPCWVHWYVLCCCVSLFARRSLLERRNSATPHQESVYCAGLSTAWHACSDERGIAAVGRESATSSVLSRTPLCGRRRVRRGRNPLCGSHSPMSGGGGRYLDGCWRGGGRRTVCSWR